MTDIAKQIDKQIADLGGWRGELAAKLRVVIGAADAGLVENWKWDTAVWESNGLVCALGSFKDHLKVNFFKGALLADPSQVFNSGLQAKISRSVDLYQGDAVDEAALQELIREAVQRNAKK